jgi:hypothetical protein
MAAGIVTSCPRQRNWEAKKKEAAGDKDNTTAVVFTFIYYGT